MFRRKPFEVPSGEQPLKVYTYKADLLKLCKLRLHDEFLCELIGREMTLTSDVTGNSWTGKYCLKHRGVPFGFLDDSSIICSYLDTLLRKHKRVTLHAEVVWTLGKCPLVEVRVPKQDWFITQMGG